QSYELFFEMPYPSLSWHSYNNTDLLQYEQLSVIILSRPTFASIIFHYISLPHRFCSCHCSPTFQIDLLGETRNSDLWKKMSTTLGNRSTDLFAFFRSF